MPEQKKLPSTLSDGAARLLLQGVRTTGSYDKDDVLPYIEESLTFDEVDQITAFLDWREAHDRSFGHNIHDVYAECVAGDGSDYYTADEDNDASTPFTPGRMTLIETPPPGRE